MGLITGDNINLQNIDICRIFKITKTLLILKVWVFLSEYFLISRNQQLEINKSNCIKDI